MKTILAAAASAAVFTTAGIIAVTPAYALGGCGPNRHRNHFGYCVFGGQNQGSCLRRTGHVATRFPDGTLRCL